MHLISFPGLPIQTVWSVFWLREKRLSPLESAFIRYLEMEKEQISLVRFSWMESYDEKLI
jgi:hypothetical protein